MSKKSPYINYSVEEIRRIESQFYCVYFGGDFLTEDNSCLFTKSEASQLFKAALKDLVGIVETGNEKDRLYALDLISTMCIKPMRIH